MSNSRESLMVLSDDFAVFPSLQRLGMDRLLLTQYSLLLPKDERLIEVRVKATPNKRTRKINDG
jgi:hypothetical protein